MLLTFLLMIASAIIIYISSELFVNGVEWVGKAFSISQNAVGTILAAFGTALPESIITFIAVVFGKNSSQKDVGIGSALGGPLVLSTIAYSIVGITILMFSAKRKKGSALCTNTKKLSRDQTWFLCIFAFKVLLGLVIFQFKHWMGFLFIAAYIVYFYIEMNTECEENDNELEPLKFSPNTKTPSKTLIVFQTLLSVLFIYLGSQLFVNKLDYISIQIGVPAHIVALILSPVATELPEILNAIIWVRQGKEQLALSNISGSMMIQATIPSALGIIFTPWLFDKILVLSSVITFSAILFTLIALKEKHISAKRLSFNAVFYILFILGIIIIK